MANAAAVPKRKKSYLSIAAPADFGKALLASAC
jgi:hypothetical protein